MEKRRSERIRIIAAGGRYDVAPRHSASEAQGDRAGVLVEGHFGNHRNTKASRDDALDSTEVVAAEVDPRREAMFDAERRQTLVGSGLGSVSNPCLAGKLREVDLGLHSQAVSLGNDDE